jgi:hypothetical protein
MKGWPLLLVFATLLLCLAFSLGAEVAFSMVESDPIVIIRDVCADAQWRAS